MNNNLNNNHEKAKKTLKIAGAVSLGAGLILAVTGFINFFASMGSDEAPKLFFLCFIGLPLMAFGGMMLLLGFGREIMRYQKNEGMPVIKETAAEVVSGIDELKQSKAEEAKNEEEKKSLTCPSCGTENDEDGNFCKNCGAKLKE